MKHFLSAKPMFVVFTSFFLLSCKSCQKTIIPGKISIFSIRTEEFLQLKPFEIDSANLGSLYINFQVDEGKFDMEGWQFGQQEPQGTNRSGFGKEPDISIHHVKSSNIEYSKGIYISSIIFTNNEVKGIMDAIKGAPGQFLVFSPKKTETNPNIIYYELNLSTSKTALEEDFVGSDNQTSFMSSKLPFPGCPMPPGCRGTQLR